MRQDCEDEPDENELRYVHTLEGEPLMHPLDSEGFADSPQFRNFLKTAQWQDKVQFKKLIGSTNWSIKKIKYVQI